MFEAKDILPLLGIPGTKIKSFNIINDGDETTNNQIQTLINLCYGLPKFERMRKRVLYINRNQKD